MITDIAQRLNSTIKFEVQRARISKVKQFKDKKGFI